MALPRLSSTTSGRTIGWFVNDREEMDLNPSYQRGNVWGEERQRALIKSVLMEYPIPAIIINDRHKAKFSHEGFSVEQNVAYAIIDGKQRITALRDLVDGKFSVPAEWFEKSDLNADAVEKKDVFWSDINLGKQRHIRQRPLSVVETYVDTLDEEADIFEMINSSGLAQGESDF